MTFKVPEFPLKCDIYSGPWLSRALRSQVDCNLAMGRRTQDYPEFFGAQLNSVQGPVFALFPPGTDIRDLNQNIGAADIVEIPSGSGRWYVVFFVEDLGKGFANEHRYALIGKASSRISSADFPGLFWPTPMP